MCPCARLPMQGGTLDPPETKKDGQDGRGRAVALAGYMHPGYARSLSDFGRPRWLSHCGGWVLERMIPGSHSRDAMGCYPIFCCNDWRGIPADLDELSEELVSIVLVTDPFGPLGQRELNAVFDRVTAFKEHFVADLTKPIDAIVSKKRFRSARKALCRLTVEKVEDPTALVDDWLALHSRMVSKLQLNGMKVLCRPALLRLFSVPGLVVLRASHEGRTVGMHVELAQGDVVYGHLAAYDEVGYRLGASYALHLWEIEHFVGKARWIDWGGVAGLVPNRADGLTAFKRGFSSETRQVYLCGKIFDAREYKALAAKAGCGPTSYFPAYRNGEFA